MMIALLLLALLIVLERLHDRARLNRMRRTIAADLTRTRPMSRASVIAAHHAEREARRPRGRR